MYELRVYVTGLVEQSGVYEPHWESRGVYDTYEEAFRAGMDGKGYAEFQIHNVGGDADAEQ